MKNKRKKKKRTNNTTAQRVEYIESRRKELIEEQNTLSFNEKDSIRLSQVKSEIDSIELRIGYNPGAVTKQEYESLDKLENEREKLIEKEQARFLKSNQYEEERKKLGIEKAELLLGKKRLKEINIKFSHKEQPMQSPNINQIKDEIIKRVVSGIESEISRQQQYKIKLNGKDVAVAMMNDFVVYSSLVNQAFPGMHITKKDYFNKICPNISIVVENKWSWISLYDAATK
ncbi:MAG: hypothetical protein ACW986_20230 [Promethearchaeota archaeon]|jgi:hypothetical protein